jgi:predicted GH43/DUF377 family glycosyl hydrolase
MEVAATEAAPAAAPNGRVPSDPPGRPSPPRVERTGIVLRPNNSRVVIRPFELADDHRIERILGRVCALTDAEVDVLIAGVLQEFHGRHQKTRQFFLQRFDQVKRLMLTDRALSENRKLLIGSYFTQEYALESAALFNPSMVWHPDQSGLPEGSKRFILSLRATGEGHISSITFRAGVVDAAHRIHMDEPTRLVTAPNVAPNTLYDKVLFLRKLIELRIDGPFADQVLEILDDQFTNEQIEAAVASVLRQNRPRHHELETLAQGILTLARSNYEITFGPELSVSERIIFPYSPTETNGIEDARFVRFQEDDGSVRYYATYTAYNGKVVFPQLLETDDFLRFKASTLNGPEVRNKGMALFPRKVNGLYAMISRQDGENIFLMYSDMLHFWYTKEQIAKPTYPWEYVQLGNCGSPIETEAGWLVLTHGVGPMRRYAMGAFLLDLHDPSRVIGRLEEPLLEPNANEREGYVPNVVYSCGALIHDGVLVIPYAMSDYASTFATVPVDDLLNAMVRD